MTHVKRTKKAFQALLICAGSLIIAFTLWFLGILDNFEGVTWNLRQGAFASREKANPEIAVILLDQDSLDSAGLSWPWPREAYKIITDFCTRAKARVLALDVVFTEPSFYGVEDDNNFKTALHGFGRAVGTIALSRQTKNDSAEPSFNQFRTLEIDNLDKWIKSYGDTKLEFNIATFPIDEIVGGFSYLSNVTQDSDPDGIYRSAAFFALYKGKIIPSMALATYIAGEKITPRMRIEGSQLMIGERRVPVTSGGKGLLRFRGKSGTYKTFSAISIIRSETQLEAGEIPEIALAELEGKYVFFGFSAPGLLDLRPTPLDSSFSGVEIHATMLDNLLSGDFISGIPIPYSMLFAIILVLASAFLALYASSAIRTVFVYSIAFVLPVASGFVAFILGYSFQIVVTELAVVLTIVSAGLVKYATEGKQKRFIKGAFSQYLSPSVIEQLLANPEKLKLGGERRELSMYFSDIQGFTTISERLAPEELTTVLNEYLSAMTDIIMEEGGTVDKYEGDAIIAFWNAPLDLPDHAIRAVRAALRCQQKLSAMRDYLKEKTGTELYMRIGLNTGNAVVGNMGSRNRFDYTMLGDSVNLAARLEGINKQFHTYTMISGVTKEKAGSEFAYRELSRVSVVGRKEPVTVFEPMFRDEYDHNKAVYETFVSGLTEYYSGNFKNAISIFKTIADQDQPAVAYISKCENLIKNPPDSWTGVWIMTSK